MMNSSKKLHIAMFPWLAYGHIIPFLQLANELAKRGHKISFLMPKTAHQKLAKNANNNLHPHLITFYGLSVPRVEGLPAGAEMTSDTDDVAALSLAMDGMKGQVKVVVEAEKPDFIFFDFAEWIPELAMEIGCKTLCYFVVSPTIAAHAREIVIGKGKVVMHTHETHDVSVVANQPINKLKEFLRKSVLGASQSDALAVRACTEMEGSHCDHLAMLYEKPLFCTGPLLVREEQEPPLEAKIAIFLEKFDPGSVVYCAFGSEADLEITQFQELILGLELTGKPFLVACTKPPKGSTSIQEAMPKGFQERVKEKGMLHQGWVPQTRILRQKSIGCCVWHGGSASMWEFLVSDCQIVVAMPNKRGDYCMNAKLLVEELQVAVEMESVENGRFLKESLCSAIKSAMDEDSQVGVLVKENHKKWRDVLLCPGFADNYIDKFIHNLYELMGH